MGLCWTQRVRDAGRGQVLSLFSEGLGIGMEDIYGEIYRGFPETEAKAREIGRASDALGTLTGREEKMLKGFYGIGVPRQRVMDIAKRQGCTSSNVYQLMRKGLRKLRRISRTEMMLSLHSKQGGGG